MHSQPPATPADAAHRCGSCRHFSGEHARLAHLGFGRCARLPEWREVSAGARCALNPSHWERGHAKAD